MTNQQLKAHCEDVIANQFGHWEDWVVDIARVALASLEAVPVGYTTERAATYEVWNSGSATFWDKNDLGDVALYTAPLVPELKPIELPNPIQQHETCKYGLEPSDAYGLYWGSKEMLRQCIKAIRAAGYEVTS